MVMVVMMTVIQVVVVIVMVTLILMMVLFVGSRVDWIAKLRFPSLTSWRVWTS